MLRPPAPLRPRRPLRPAGRPAGPLLGLLCLLIAASTACDAGDPERVLVDGTPATDARPLDRGPVDAAADGGAQDGASAPTDDGAPADAGPLDGALPDTGPADAGPTDAGPADAGPDDTVAVAHPRELRGVWIATVYNINFPSRAARDPAGQEAALVALLDVAAEAGLNAVFFQVRPEGDAFWPTARAPWSRFLTGTQGADPGYDPLGVLVEAAHARGLEVHAWFNPYRAAVDPARPLHPSHPAARFPEHAHVYRNQLWLDPGAAAVRADVVATLVEAVEAYDLDGVHFDDYVYPYPDDSPFPDDLTWAAYQAGGGELSRPDWRRENVNALIRDVDAAVHAADPDLLFGVSPFGIYRPGIPAGIVGLDQYASLYADPPRWFDAGWVDYLAPQLYWNASRPQQDYETLLAWWTSLVAGERYIVAGNYLSELGSAAAWDTAEFERQVALSRAYAGVGSLGNIYFQIEPLRANRDGIRDRFRDVIYATPARPPARPGRAAVFVAPPTLTPDGDGLRIDHPDRAVLRGFVRYTWTEGGWVVRAVLPPDATRVVPGEGDEALSAIRRGGAESLGRRLPR